ncbi:hypothetical protein NL676_024283 [Syzygium grande]|nr:hypothetical protein NL676_024283 [Syzygium grande]
MEVYRFSHRVMVAIAALVIAIVLPAAWLNPSLLLLRLPETISLSLCGLYLMEIEQAVEPIKVMDAMNENETMEVNAMAEPAIDGMETWDAMKPVEAVDGGT